MADKFLATNKKTSRELFEERTVYKLEAFTVKPGSVVGNEAIRDFWELDNIYYGRMDLDNRPILPKASRLRNLANSDNKTIFALDFVADAFNSLKKTAKNRIDDGCLAMENRDGSSESYIGLFEPVRAFVSLPATYRRNLKIYFHLFKERYLKDGANYSNVLGLDDFLVSFKYFMVNAVGGRLPFTLSNTVVSPYGSPLNTGIAVDIAALGAGSDPEKEDDFINNPRLNFYKNIAQEYGFYIDKNVPWRLVANLKSPLMEPYIVNRFPKYNGLESLFDEYYEPATALDVELLKSSLLKFYNRFAAQRRIEVIEVRKGACKTTVAKRRETISRESMDEIYGNQFWLDMYITFRNLEGTLGYEPQALSKIIKNAQDLEKAVDIDRAIAYIDYKFKGMTSIPRSFAYDSLTSSLAESGLTVREETRTIQQAAQLENLIVY